MQEGDPFGLRALMRPDTMYTFVGGPADGERQLLKSGFLQVEVVENNIGAYGGTHIYHRDPHDHTRMLYQGRKNVPKPPDKRD